LLATEPAAAENCALVEPAGTETAAGAESEEALLDRVTLAPPEPAPWDKVTVQVVVPPDAMLVGVQATEVSVIVAATNVIDAVCELPLKVAVITAPEPLPAVAVKVPVTEPAATETVAGTVMAAVLLLDRATLTPPEPAVCDKVTVQVVVAPGAMLAGEQATEVRLDVSDANVIDAVCELPFNVAVTAATWPAAPLPAPAEKVPLVAPAVMEIVAGTVIVVVLLDRATLTPPEGAACESATVHRDEVPDVTVDGAQESPLTSVGEGPGAGAEPLPSYAPMDRLAV